MDELKPLSEAASPEEFKTLRAAHREATAPVAEKPVETQESKPVETAAETGTAKQKVQEVPVAEKSVDDQIKELRAKGNHPAANKLEREAGAAEARKASDEEIARLKQEMEALRRPQPERPAEVKTEVQAQPQVDPNDPEPKPEDAKYAGANGYEKYLRDCGRWDYRQESRAQQAQQGQKAAIDSRRTKVAAAKAKYVDFDAVTAADPATGTGLILTAPMIQYFDAADSGAEVLYHLGKHPDDYARIKALDPTLQLAELGYLGKLIVTPPAGTPEKKTPAVSKVSAPPRVLSGTDAPPPKALSEASSLEEFKRLRKNRTA